MSFIQLKRIKEIDDTPEKAIASYGSFVSFMNETETKIKKSKRKDWTPERMAFSRGKNTIGSFHQAIYDKFGREVLIEAINAHPFQ